MNSRCKKSNLQLANTDFPYIKTLLIKPFNHATYHYWNQPSSNTPWYSSIKLVNKKTLNQESNIIKKNLDKLD